jgi:hypothetical protein
VNGDHRRLAIFTVYPRIAVHAHTPFGRAGHSLTAASKAWLKPRFRLAAMVLR